MRVGRDRAGACCYGPAFESVGFGVQVKRAFASESLWVLRQSWPKREGNVHRARDEGGYHLVPPRKLFLCLFLSRLANSRHALAPSSANVEQSAQINGEGLR